MLNKLTDLDSGEDIQSKWNRLLQVMFICKNHNSVQSLSSINGAVSPNPIIEDVLPSLILLQFVSLFEDAAIQKMQSEGWKLQKKVTLNNLIEFLSKRSSILNFSAIDSIRIIRNDVAHNLKFVGWTYLLDSVDIIEKELQNWGLIGSRPAYHFFGTRSQAKILEKEDLSETEEFALSFDYEFGIKLDDKKILTYSWTSIRSLPKDKK